MSVPLICLPASSPRLRGGRLRQRDEKEIVMVAYVVVEIAAGRILLQEFLVNMHRYVKVMIRSVVADEPDAQPSGAARRISPLGLP
ncbi:hypothetical protein ABIA16_000687 [Sinorhizobium fredii]